MATVKQVLANQKNAKKSTGPKTISGKRRSSLNSIKHGLTCEKNVSIGENQVTARFADYELGFQMIVFDGDTKPSMTMSKYDFKNNRFLEHYQCDFKSANIE